jgi:D-tyrosyl-tRNA(Tyr) deacylase
MRACIQRVTGATVDIAGVRHAAIGRGLLVLLGVGHDDVLDDATWLAGKTARLRIFPDERGLMNRSVTDLAGEVLVVSQFTLFADALGGNRPSFTAAARPEHAVPLYECYCTALTTALGRQVQTGVFAADMQVSLVNDGPVTIWLDTALRA